MINARCRKKQSPVFHLPELKNQHFHFFARYANRQRFTLARNSWNLFGSQTGNCQFLDILYNLASVPGQDPAWPEQPKPTNCTKPAPISFEAHSGLIVVFTVTSSCQATPISQDNSRQCPYKALTASYRCFCLLWVFICHKQRIASHMTPGRAAAAGLCFPHVRYLCIPCNHSGNRETFPVARCPAVRLIIPSWQFLASHLI